MIKIEHHANKCSGCGVCVDFLPAYYRMNGSTGRAELINAKKNKSITSLELPQTESEIFKEVSKLCPDKVIRPII